MREIKFRGKRKYNGEWVKGYLVLDAGENDAPRIIIDRQYSSGANYIANAPRVAHDSVGQYTGLHDKNGEDIYDGDIVLATYKEIRDFRGVKYESETRMVETVVFNEATSAFELQIDLDGVKLYRRLIIGDTVNNVELVSLEVIGNIYDNPELLKGDRQ